MTRSRTTLLAAVLAIVCAVPCLANDQQIAETIAKRLNHQRQAAQLEQFDLGIQVSEGTVTMSGELTSPDQAMLALDVARRVPGVKLVVNQLYVRPAAPQQATHPASVAEQSITDTITLATTGPADSPATELAVGEPPAPPTPTSLSIPAPPIPSVGAAVTADANDQSSPQLPVAFAPSQLPTHRLAPAGGPQDQAAENQAAQNQAAQYQAAQYQAAQYQAAQYQAAQYQGAGAPMPVPIQAAGGGVTRAAYDNPQMPAHAWPSYAAYPNYASVAYPQQYSPTAWPYIGPFYPYPQVPLGWRKVTLEWDDGWWFLDFQSK